MSARACAYTHRAYPHTHTHTHTQSHTVRLSTQKTVLHMLDHPFGCKNCIATRTYSRMEYSSIHITQYAHARMRAHTHTHTLYPHPKPCVQDRPLCCIVLRSCKHTIHTHRPYYHRIHSSTANSYMLPHAHTYISHMEYTHTHTSYPHPKLRVQDRSFGRESRALKACYELLQVCVCVCV